MSEKRIAAEIVADENQRREVAQRSDYQALGEKLARSSIDIEAITAKVAEFFVAVPSWGVGTGGTRFARFPGQGEPRHIFDKLD
ncbi:MAG: sugar isomerase, partial [Rhizobium rhizophilum]